jgi:hypothetical protein
VFALINPADTGKAGWLSPMQSDYAYVQTGAGQGYLAILSVTSARNISQLPRQVDPAIVANLQQAIFVISPGMFMQNVIMPMLPAAYGHGTTAQTFTYNPVTGTIANTGNISTDGVKKGAITYDPYIGTLAIAIQAGNLNTAVTGGCDLGLNMSMTFSISCSCPAVFDATSRTLSFLRDPNPQESHDSHIPWYDYAFGPLADLIIALVVPSIAGGIADNLTSQLQNLALVNSPPQSVQWAGLGAMQVQNAGLATSFYLVGTLQQVSGAAG